jgi:hypothetical protein
MWRFFDLTRGRAEALRINPRPVGKNPRALRFVFRRKSASAIAGNPPPGRRDRRKAVESRIA